MSVNGPLKIDYATGCVYLDDAEVHLTPIEYKLLCLLAQNADNVCDYFQHWLDMEKTL